MTAVVAKLLFIVCSLEAIAIVAILTSAKALHLFIDF
jgi:hypothetical protein